uniref:Uncharacterized protein n=1 Tax=Candidozyma auris TaxID=498019 RepID=A0A0L0P666_CANAR
MRFTIASHIGWQLAVLMVSQQVAKCTLRRAGLPIIAKISKTYMEAFAEAIVTS